LEEAVLLVVKLMNWQWQNDEFNRRSVTIW